MYINKQHLLVALYVFGVISVQVLGVKTTTLYSHGSFMLSASVGVFILPLLFTAPDVMVEVFGKKEARSLVICGLITSALFIAFAAFATNVSPSPRFSGTEHAYDQIFSSSLRIAAASLAAFATAELLDIFVYVQIRSRLANQGLWLRNNASNFVSQLIDSCVFLTLAFYSFNETFLVNLAFLFSLMLPYWLLRCGLSVIQTPITYGAVRWLKGGAELTR